MDPIVIISALEAVTAILKQVEIYSRGQMSEEELQLCHQRVMAFMMAVQADADTLRKDPSV
jgi:hypothetical protein